MLPPAEYVRRNWGNLTCLIGIGSIYWVDKRLAVGHQLCCGASIHCARPVVSVDVALGLGLITVLSMQHSVVVKTLAGRVLLGPGYLMPVCRILHVLLLMM